MNIKKNSLSQSEHYRLVKYIGLNGGFLVPSIVHGVIQTGDFGWLMLPGILIAITTPVTMKSFKKIDKQNLLRILGTLTKANAVIAPLALGLILYVRTSASDPSSLREFSFAQVAEVTMMLTALLFFVDFWIESAAKLGEYKQTGDLTDNSNHSPITNGLETAADKIINQGLNFIVKFKEKFIYKNR